VFFEQELNESQSELLGRLRGLKEVCCNFVDLVHSLFFVYYLMNHVLPGISCSISIFMSLGALGNKFSLNPHEKMSNVNLIFLSPVLVPCQDSQRKEELLPVGEKISVRIRQPWP